MSMLTKITNDLLNKVITELQQPENKKKINDQIVNPLIYDISKRIYPYLITVSIMYIIILVLMISILILLIKN